MEERQETEGIIVGKGKGKEGRNIPWSQPCSSIFFQKAKRVCLFCKDFIRFVGSFNLVPVLPGPVLVFQEFLGCHGLFGRLRDMPPLTPGLQVWHMDFVEIRLIAPR